MKRRLREDPFGWRSASQLGQLQLAWSSPEWVGLATSLWQSAGRYPDAHGIYRLGRSAAVPGLRIAGGGFRRERGSPVSASAPSAAHGEFGLSTGWARCSTVPRYS